MEKFVANEPTADELAGQEGRAIAGGMTEVDRLAGAPEGGFNSYGISGLSRFGSTSRVYEEFLRELQGPAGMKSYREMSDNDPIVGSTLFAAQHLCRKVTFGFKPANESNEAQKIADFVGGAIFDDMDQTWQDTLSEILTMLPFGWSLLEYRMKKRMGMGDMVLTPEAFATGVGRGISGQGSPVPDTAPSRFSDGLIGFRSWSLRSQETLFMWEWDEESNATVMQQMAPPDYKIRRIPLAKALLFRTQVSRNNPEGRSMLRNAWTSYYLKKNIQIFEGIGIERDLAGYPMIQMEKPDTASGLVPPDIWNPNDSNMVSLLAAMQKIVKSVRVDEQMGLVMPWWAKFSLVNGGSRRRVDTNSIIARYDQRIAQSMMSDFIMLGHEAVGSKALAATKISLFTAALSSFLDVVGAVIDRKAVPILLAFNGMPQELAPKFFHGDVESVNIQELGEFIAKVAGTGFNPLASFDAQKTVMSAARLPITGMEHQKTGIPNDKTTPGGTEKPSGASPNRVGDNMETGSGRSMAPVSWERTPTGLPEELENM